MCRGRGALLSRLTYRGRGVKDRMGGLNGIPRAQSRLRCESRRQSFSRQHVWNDRECPRREILAGPRAPAPWHKECRKSTLMRIIGAFRICTIQGIGGL
jgi:hypothetical protein